MNTTKRNIYLVKAGLIELIPAVVIWETAGKWPGLLTVFVTLCKMGLQIVNTWGSFLSDPTGSKNGNGAPPLATPPIEPPAKP